MAESNQTNKYAYLSRLSTKELESILRADAESPNAVNDKAISYILEVIEQREHEHPSDSFPDVDHSWNEFLAIYNTPEGTGQSLYPNGDNEDPHVLPTHLIQKRQRIIRRSILVAAITVLLIASLTIPVAGFGNLLEMIGSWTAEQFTFITTGNKNSTLSEENDPNKIGSPDDASSAKFLQVFREHGIVEPVTPTWMPDGFELIGDISVQEYPDFGETEFFYSYSKGSDVCSVSITQQDKPKQGNIYEKVPGDPEIYVVDNVDHYIIQNKNSLIAAWYVGNLECSINTTMSESELKRVIDSIYY